VKKFSDFPSLVLKKNISKAFKKSSKLKLRGTIAKKFLFFIYSFVCLTK